MDRAFESQGLDFGNQYLCAICLFSPFLRSSSGRKSCTLSNYHQPEATSSGKVYFTKVCLLSERAARQKDYLQYLFGTKSKQPSRQLPGMSLLTLRNPIQLKAPVLGFGFNEKRQFTIRNCRFQLFQNIENILTN